GKAHQGRSDDQGNDRHQFDQDVQGGSRSVLEGIPNGIPDHGGLMGLTAFSAFAFNGLLGIVPGPTGIGLENGHEHPGHSNSGQEASQHFNATDKTNGHGHQYGQ